MTRLGKACFGALLALAISWPAAPQVPPGIGEGWLGEFEHAARQLLQLAEATPAEKYTWRPAEGVRSISEVYMHVALGNLFLLAEAGAKPSLADDVFLRILVHNHEHMGQAVAYARMNGIVPPWSAKQ